MGIQLEFEFDAKLKSDTEKQKPALPYFDSPKCDNERLLNCQWAYRHGSQTALQQMYLLGYTVAMRYISAKARKNRHIAQLCIRDREEKAHNAITYIIARYLRIKDFAIQKSFTAYLYLRIQHELFYRRKVDKIVGFVDMETFYRSMK